MYKIILSIGIVFFLASCNESVKKEQESSELVLSVEAFTDLMVDVQLLEGHLNTNRVDQVFIVDSTRNFYKEVLNKHGVSFEAYKENLKYYTARPKVLEGIYEKVEEKLLIQERLYQDVVITQPAISPINKSELLKIIAADKVIANFVLDSTVNFLTIKDSLFSYYSDSLLEIHNTDALSFQQSFNVSTHSKPLFTMFKGELENKLEKISKND